MKRDAWGEKIGGGVSFGAKDVWGEKIGGDGSCFGVIVS